MRKLVKKNELKFDEVVLNFDAVVFIFDANGYKSVNALKTRFLLKIQRMELTVGEWKNNLVSWSFPFKVLKIKKYV